jgi:dephospho-CoA kinase
MVLIIGVTGSIASGKSYLCRYLVEHHEALHLDADREAHELYAPGTPGFDRVVAEFGSDVVGAGGVIDRKILGAKVFGNPGRMQALRDAMGDIPAHFMAILDRWRSELPADSIALLESINLFENGYIAKCDAGWLVACERETAIARLIGDRGLTREEAEQRLASARDWRERAHSADRVFHNNGTATDFAAAIERAIVKTRSMHPQAGLPRAQWNRTQDTALS